MGGVILRGPVSAAITHCITMGLLTCTDITNSYVRKEQGPSLDLKSKEQRANSYYMVGP